MPALFSLFSIGATVRGAVLCAGLALGGIAAAVPHIPADGKQVVERLPSRTDPVQRELARLRAELGKSPANLKLAAALAQRYIEQARLEGDPRYLGYAEAVLAPWWKQAEPPSEILVLRATLRQSTHQFGAALADLDAVVKRDSDNAQAWLTRATILTITGNFAAARASCMRLYSRAPGLVVDTCLAEVANVSGQAPQSYAALTKSLERHADADPGLRVWVQTLLAEMAARLGDSAAAERWFRQALAFDDADSYLLAAYADFLLDQRRPAEVVKLLKDKTRVDSLLLRYAIAMDRTDPAAAQVHRDALRARFDAAMLRGDTVHQREQARFELVLRKDPAAAVRLAKLNWAVQKEPADLRILLESAAASRDPEAKRLALDWIANSKLQDRTLDATLAQLKAKA